MKHLQAEELEKGLDAIRQQLTPKDVIEIYSYTSTEQESFPYLRHYMKFVSKRLTEIECDEEMLKRFALAGLFLTYRAFNHQGNSMQTESLSDFDSDAIHTKRLIMFKKYFQTDIKSTNHYLKLINFSAFDYVLLIFRLKSLSRKLYKFVVK